MNEYKIAIIGPSDTVSGFRALGVDAFGAQTGEGALEKLRELKKAMSESESATKYAVVCIIEDLLIEV